LAQERLRAVRDVFPELRLHAREELPRRAMPAVPEVVRDFLEPRKGRGNPRTYLHDLARAAPQRPVLHSSFLSLSVLGPVTSGRRPSARRRWAAWFASPSRPAAAARCLRRPAPSGT